MITETSQTIVGIDTTRGECEVCLGTFDLNDLSDPFPGCKTAEGKPSPECLVCQGCTADHLAELDEAIALYALYVHDGDDAVTCTLAAFIDDNADGIDDEDIANIRALAVGDSVRFGGGAAPLFTVTRTA